MPEGDSTDTEEMRPYSGHSGHQHVENHIALSDGGVKWLIIFLIALLAALFSSCVVAIQAQEDVKHIAERLGELQDRADRVDIWGQEVSGELDRLEIRHNPYPKRNR